MDRKGPISAHCDHIVSLHTVKHHPEPWRGEPMAVGHRPDRGMLPVGVVSTGKLKTSSRMIEQR